MSGHCGRASRVVAADRRAAAQPPELHPIEPLLEFDQSEHPLRMAVVREPIEQRRGWVEVPQGPGLGIEIDRAALARFAV